MVEVAAKRAGPYSIKGKQLTHLPNTFQFHQLEEVPGSAFVCFQYNRSVPLSSNYSDASAVLDGSYGIGGRHTTTEEYVRLPHPIRIVARPRLVNVLLSDAPPVFFIFASGAEKLNSETRDALLGMGRTYVPGHDSLGAHNLSIFSTVHKRCTQSERVADDAVSRAPEDFVASVNCRAKKRLGRTDTS